MKYLITILLMAVSCRPSRSDNNEGGRLLTIGTKYFRWTDFSRNDEYYGESRLINAQVWYPIIAQSPTDKYPRSPYYYEIDKVYKNLDSWDIDDFNRVSSIASNAVLNAPIKDSDLKYPLIIFSPSLGGNISHYSFYAENLAQAGFVVLGINHLHESEYVVDVIGKVYTANLSFHDSLKSLNIPEQITAEGYREAKSARMEVLGEDLVFALNQLEINEAEFMGKIDFEAVGVFGHSIGGAAAIYASTLDQRFKAVLNIDGTPPSKALQTGIDVPFMFIEDLTDYRNHSGYRKMHDRRDSFCMKNASDSYRILMANVNHNSFLDINYHLTSDKDEKEKAISVLSRTNFFMTKFFSSYLGEGILDLTPIQSDTLEIVTYVKKGWKD